MLWLGVGTNTSRLGLGNIHTCFGRHKQDRRCLEVSLKTLVFVGTDTVGLSQGLLKDLQ